MLHVEGISFAFGNRPVLDGISLHCADGETIGIVGKSGVGKSTLLNIIAGVLPYSHGIVEVDGAKPSRASQEQRISYLFQSPTLLPWRTAAQNVALPLLLRNHGMTFTLGSQGNHRGQIDHHAVEAALRQAHIADAAHKFPRELSGGMQTRVLLARAIVQKPSLLLADEPFNALDDIMKETLYTDLQEIIGAWNASTVIVTHNLSEAILLSDRVYVLRGEPSGPNTVVHCEHIPFDRPRSNELLNDSSLVAIRKTMREILE